MATHPVRTSWLIIAIISSMGASHPVPLLAQALPRPEGVTAVPNTNDLEDLVRELGAAGTTTKSEFETTAQFEARVKQSKLADRKYAFVYGSYASSSSASQTVPESLVPLITQRTPPSFAYNADSGLMTTSIPDDLTLKVVARRADSAIGQNSFGARAEFRSVLADEFAVNASRASAFWLNDALFRDYPFPNHPQFSFPLGIDHAREVKPYLRVVLVGTLTSTEVKCQSFREAATLSKPFEIERRRCSVDFDITELHIIDARTGTGVITFNSSIGPHKIGEKFRDWLSAEGLDKACQKAPKTAACQMITAIRKTGNGEFVSASGSRQDVSWIFSDGKLDRIRSKPAP